MFSHGAVGLSLTCRIFPAADSASTVFLTAHCAGALVLSVVH